MNTPTDSDGEGIVAGLIVAIGDDQYIAIAWDDLQPYRVPAAWVAALAALVHGEEPAGGEEARGHAGAVAPTATHALLIEAAGEMRAHRPAAHRLEAWVLLR
jgi:hypothetical protein